MTLADLALILGSLGTGSVITKILDYRGSRATVQKTEVETIRSVLEELRNERADDRDEITDLKVRVGVLEKREREQMTLIAVHDAWDQIAHAALVAVNPAHPPPPPLIPPATI